METRRSILVVDDDRRILSLFRRVLGKAFPEDVIFYTESGEDCIEIAVREQPDLIILDIVLPGINGPEVCRQLRRNERTTHIPILMISGKRREPASRAAGLEVGADGYLVKPFENRELVAQAKALLRIVQRERKLVSLSRVLQVEKRDADKLRKTKNELERSYMDLQTSKDELIRSERQAFTGRIAANIAHEVRNPLVNVSMGISEIKRLLKDRKDVTRYVDITQKNVDRISFLIQELLQSARPPKLELRRHNICRLLENVLEIVETKAQSQKVRIQKRVTSKRSVLEFDREQMRRVFSNLAVNAIEAMPDGGSLSITTECEKDIFQTKFQDTGCGISDENLLRIFDPFFSSKSEGVGLGLTICYGIVVSHGGNIEVESELNRGSTFVVSLPLQVGGKVGEELR